MSDKARHWWNIVDTNGNYAELERQGRAFADIWAQCDAWCAERNLTNADLVRLTKGYHRAYDVSAAGIMVLCHTHFRVRLNGGLTREPPLWFPLAPSDVRYAARGEVVHRKRRYYTDKTERADHNKRLSVAGGKFRRDDQGEWSVCLRGHWEPWTKPRFREMGEERAWIDKGVVTTNRRMLETLSEQTGKEARSLRRNMQAAQREVEWPMYVFRLEWRLARARVNAQSEREAERILSGLDLGAPVRDLRKVI